jgi:hypothetical protein
MPTARGTVLLGDHRGWQWAVIAWNRFSHGPYMYMPPFTSST